MSILSIKKSLAVIAVALFSFALLFSFASATTASIQLTSPTNSGIYWSGTHDITWTQLGGTSSDNASILLSSGGSYNNLVTDVDVTSGTYSWNTTDPIVGVSDGSTYKIKVSNLSNGIADASLNYFTVDNTAPTTTYGITPTAPASTGWYNISTGAPTVTLSCTDTTSGCQKINWGFVGVNAPQTNSGGDTAAFLVAAGEHQIVWRATDNALNVETLQGPNSVKVDITAPATPVITSIAGDNYINNSEANTTTVVGTAEANSTVSVTLSDSGTGSVTVTGTADGSGAFSINLNTPSLIDGTITPTVNATDTAGNISSDAASPTATKDVVAPTTTGAPDLTSTTDTGDSSSDDITNDNTPDYYVGSCTTGNVVTIYATSTAKGSATCGSGGNVTVTTSSVTSDGTSNITFTEADPAGNESAQSTYLSVTTDTSAPVAPVVTGITNDTGFSSTDGITNDNTLVFIGTASSDTTNVEVFIGGVSIGTATVTSGVWSFGYTSTTLSDGNHAITAKASDIAGNKSGASTAFNVVVDTSAPTAPISSYTFDGVAGNAFFNPGTVSLGMTANEPLKWLSVQFQKVSDPTNIYKTYFIDTNFDGTTNATQVWNGILSNNTSAPDGTYEIEAHVEDLAGNDTTVVLGTHTVTVDTANPTITGFTSPTTDTVYRTDPTLTFTPNDTGTGTLNCTYSLDSGSAVSVTPCTSGTSASATLSGLSDGRHNVAVTVTDQAGNVVNPIPAVSFVYDTDGTLTVGTIPAQDFNLIQNAVDASLTGGEVDVQPGTYAESVLISKPLTVIGVGATKPIITGDDSTYNYIVKIDGANGITLDKFEVNGGGTGTGDNAFDYGILVTGSGTVAKPTIVSNSVVKNIWKVSSNGIDINTGSYALVHDNNISSIHKRSIRFTNSTGKIYNNVIVGDNVGSISRVQNLINLWGGSNVEIYENNLDGGMSAPGGTWSSPAIFVSEYGGTGPSTANIHNNDIHDGDVAIDVGSIYAATDTSSVVVVGNNIHNMESGIVFERNTVTATIEYNQIVNVITGARSPYWAVTPYPTYIAEKNWWGDATGPFNTAYNPLGTGSPTDDQVDISPFCTDVPVYNSGTWSCTLASIDPIASFDLAFDTNPQTVGGSSTLTVIAKDASGYTVVNDSSTKMNIAGDNGSSFGSTLLTMGALGTTGTTITNTIAGPVNVTATEVGGTATGAGTITFTATPIVQPTIVLTGTAIASPYTATEAAARFGSGLQFDISNATSYVVTVNGVASSAVTITPTTSPVTTTVVNTTDATTLGLHLYKIEVTSSTGNTASKTVAYQVNANAVVPITPTITLSGTAIATSYTSTEAGTRFGSGLQFTTTNADSVTVNGTSVTTGATVTAVSASDAVIIGLHVYNVVVTSTTGNTANITVSYTVVADFNDTATLAVTGIDAVNTYATDDNTYANGWSWVYHITVPTGETDFQMKFSDFVSGANTVPAASNIRFFTAQASAHSGATSAIGITAANAFSIPPITLDGDLSPTTPGRQIDVTVEMRVPTGTTGGSYSGSYGVQTQTPQAN